MAPLVTRRLTDDYVMLDASDGKVLITVSGVGAETVAASIIACVNSAALLAATRPFVALGLEALGSSCKIQACDLEPDWTTLPENLKPEHAELTALLRQIDLVIGEARADG